MWCPSRSAFINKVKTKQTKANCNLESNNKKRCLSDEPDLDNNAKKNAKRRCLYQEHLENNRAKQVQRYKKKRENILFKRRLRYQEHLEQNRAKQVQRYKKERKNILFKRRFRYQQDIENEQEISNLTLAKNNTAKNIRKKYVKLRSKIFMKIRDSAEEIVKNI